MFEDSEAVITMIIGGKSPGVRHVIHKNNVKWMGYLNESMLLKRYP